MSKIGKKPIKIPEGIEVNISGNEIKVKGGKGELALTMHPKIVLEQKDGDLMINVKNPEDRKQRALWGTFRSLVSNLVIGVSEGFEKRLEINGVGYKASVAGDKLVLNVGYSHPIDLAIPKGLQVKVEKNTISVGGPDKQVVGEFAALVRSQRKPEPYKGKGIKYSDEVVRRKAGKVMKAAGG